MKHGKAVKQSGNAYANNGTAGQRSPGFVNNGPAAGGSPAAYVSKGPVGTPTRTDFGSSMLPGGGISSSNKIKR